MKVAVLGGGIVGMSIGNQLLRDGYEVMVVEREPEGESASFGNAGIIADYATIPLANPSTLRTLPGLLLSRRGSVSFRFSYLPSLIRFGFQFFHASQERNFDRNHRILANLVPLACSKFQKFIVRFGLQDLVRSNGCLMVYRGEAAWRDATRTQIPLRQADGVQCSLVTPDEVQELEPAIPAPRVRGGVLYPGTQHLIDPAAYRRRLTEIFVRGGGKLVNRSVEIIRETDESSGFIAEGVEYNVDRIVIAMGPASHGLAAQLGLRVPLVSERGYHLMMDSTELNLSRPVGWMEHHFLMTPMRKGVRVAGTTEFAHPGAVPRASRWSDMAGWVNELTGRTPVVSTQWVGARASTPDALPLIGWVTQAKRVALATGHNHIGLTCSALTAAMVSELMHGENDSDLARHLSPSRFVVSRK